MSVLSKILDSARTVVLNNRKVSLQPYQWTQEPPERHSVDELKKTINSFDYWYQRIYLGQDVYTMDGPPAYHEYVWQAIAQALPDNLNNASVLDIGTNAGYFSIQSKLLGADRVVGVESIDDYFKQAEFCRSVWDLEIEYKLLDAHNVNQLTELFDIIIFTGILYHLKNPLQVIEEVGQLCKDTIIVETEIVPEDPRNTIFVRQGPLGAPKLTETNTGFMKFIEKYELNGDGSNWWVPDTECVIGMLRTAGFKTFSKPIYTDETRLLIIASKSVETFSNLTAFDEM